MVEMVDTVEISRAEWLELYAQGVLERPINVNVNGEQRAYALTTAGQGGKSEGYKVVYAVV